MRAGQNRGAGQSTDYGYPNTYGRRLTPRPLFMPIVRIGFSGRVYFRIYRSTAPCRNPHHLFPLIRFYGPCPASAGAGCGGRLRARSYRLRVAVVFVHAFGFELVAGGFEASFGFASLVPYPVFSRVYPHSDRRMPCVSGIIFRQRLQILKQGSPLRTARRNRTVRSNAMRSRCLF